MKEEYKMMAWSNKPRTSSVFRVKKFIDLYRKETELFQEELLQRTTREEERRSNGRKEEPSTRL
jgi:hypothetical protein